MSSFVTSYIPTVASQVTRSADSASITGSNFSSIYNTQQGALYVEFDAYSISGTQMIANLGDSGTGSEAIDLRLPSTTMGYVRISNVNVIQWPAVSLTANTNVKTMVTYKSGAYAISTNGANLSTNTNSTIPTTIVQLNIGNRYGSLQNNGHFKRLSYYPIALSSANLVALTTL